MPDNQLASNTHTTGNNEHPDRVQLLHRPVESLNYNTFSGNNPVASTGSKASLINLLTLRLFSALSTLGTLGAGFTLSVVVQSSSSPNPGGINPSLVNAWAAISSVLFVLTVLVCQGCSQLFKFEQGCIIEGIDNDEHLIKWALAGLSLLLEAQVLGAFLFLELVLTAHSPVVGWVGVAITSLLALIALVLWAFQATGRKPIARYRRFAMPKTDKATIERIRRDFRSVDGWR